jgi:hypothetical protein
MRAAERLSRVVRAFQDGILDPADYAQQRAGLLAEREAAEAAVARAQKRSEAVSDEGVSDEVLDRLRDLRAAVLGGLDRAPDLDALRRLLREMFESVSFVPGANGEGATLIFGLKWDVIDLDAPSPLSPCKQPNQSAWADSHPRPGSDPPPDRRSPPPRSTSRSAPPTPDRAAPHPPRRRAHPAGRGPARSRHSGTPHPSAARPPRHTQGRSRSRDRATLGDVAGELHVILNHQHAHPDIVHHHRSQSHHTPRPCSAPPSSPACCTRVTGNQIAPVSCSEPLHVFQWPQPRSPPRR